jgi:hypothetical protein
MASATTRSHLNDIIFGTVSEFDSQKLPTIEDIIKNYLFIKNVHITHDRGQRKTIISELVNKITYVWRRASIPITHERTIEIKIDHYINEYYSLLKSVNRANFEKMANDFRQRTNILFDAACCKCETFSDCQCERGKKVPIQERSFLVDQRSMRKMVIGAVDTEQTCKKLSMMERNAATLQRQEATKKPSAIGRGRGRPRKEVEVIIPPGRGNKSVETYEESKLMKNVAVGRGRGLQCRLDFGPVVLESDRFLVSTRATAAITTAALQSVGFVSKENASFVVDRSKIKRSQDKLRTALQQQKPNQLQSIYFDGRKDETLHNIKRGNSYHMEKYKEEHIAIIEEPNSLYVTHVTPRSGTSENIVAAMTSYFEKEYINTEEVFAIGCDGCNVNVGEKGGIICLLEHYFNRPVHWFICLLHANELLLRKIFETIDGVTSGPKSFTGIIGQSIIHCEELPILKFKAIKIEQLLKQGLELSTDQELLYDMCRAIHKGHVSEELANKKPGPVSHARWLTTAIRILRLYVSVENPSEGLIDITTFIMYVYAKVWFRIRMHPYCSDGPKHLLEMVHSTRYLKLHLRTGIDKVIQRNSFFAHHEALLLAMVCDDNDTIRELGYRRVLKVRESQEKGKLPLCRRFTVPHINFDATEYYDLIAWQTIDSAPPLLENISTAELRRAVEEKHFPIIHLKFPCHTQAVERAIKIVTEAALHVCGQERRDGLIRSRITARELRKTFETKKEFFKS